MFMNPIPIGSSPAKKDTPGKDGNSTTTSDEQEALVLAEEALSEFARAEEQAQAIAKARRTGAGMLGTLINVKA